MKWINMTSTPAECIQRKRVGEGEREKMTSKVYDNSSVDTRRPIYLFVTQGTKNVWLCWRELTRIVRLLLRQMILYWESLFSAIHLCVFFSLTIFFSFLLLFFLVRATFVGMEWCDTNTRVWLINRPNLTDWKTTLSDYRLSTFI